MNGQQTKGIIKSIYLKASTVNQVFKPGSKVDHFDAMGGIIVPEDRKKLVALKRDS